MLWSGEWCGGKHVKSHYWCSIFSKTVTKSADLTVAPFFSINLYTSSVISPRTKKWRKFPFYYVSSICKSARLSDTPNGSNTSKTANSSAYTTRFGSASNTTSPRFNITIRPQSISTSVRSCDINRTEQLLALICSKMPQTPITSFLDKLVVTSSSKIMSLGSELTDAQTSYILRLSP